MRFFVISGCFFLGGAIGGFGNLNHRQKQEYGTGFEASLGISLRVFGIFCIFML